MPSGDAGSLERLSSEAYTNIRKFEHEKPKHKPKPEPKWVKELEQVRHKLGGLSHHVSDILTHTETAIGVAGIGTIFSVLTELWTNSAHMLNIITNPHNVAPGAEFEALGEPFVRLLIEDSLGVDLNPPNSGAGNARATIARMAGFTIAFQFATAGFVALGKTILCERFPEVLAESIGKLGEELGLNFAIGEILSSLFEQAVGKPIEESINIQLHPNRPDMMVLRALVRQGHIDPALFTDTLNRLGFEDKWQVALQQMDDKQLPLPELMTLTQLGILKAGQLDHYLKGQGYTETDREYIGQLAVQKSETQGASFLRSVGRSLVKSRLITTGQYGAILKEIGVSDEDSRLEIEAVNLELSHDSAHISLGMLKVLYQSNESGKGQVDQVLTQQGYTETDINLIETAWNDQIKAHTKHLAPGTITRFVKYGLLSDGEARAKLVALGYSSDDSDKYIALAGTHAPAAKHPLTSGTIISALKFGVITVEEAHTKLVAAGQTEDAATLMLETAEREPHKNKHAASQYKQIAEKDIGTALGEGLRDVHWAYNEFLNTGYSPDDSELLATIYLPPRARPALPGGPNAPGGSIA